MRGIRHITFDRVPPYGGRGQAHPLRGAGPCRRRGGEKKLLGLEKLSTGTLSLLYLFYRSFYNTF